MPVLCLTIDNGPWLPSLHRGSRCFVVVASSWRYVRADEDLRSVLPRSTLQLSPQLCVLIQVRTQIRGPRPRLSSLCACGQDGGQRLRSPWGSGQQPWQEKAGGCLAVDFLWCRWGGWWGGCLTHGAFTASGILKICKRRLTPRGKGFFLCVLVWRTHAHTRDPCTLSCMYHYLMDWDGELMLYVCV